MMAKGRTDVRAACSPQTNHCSFIECDAQASHSEGPLLHTYGWFSLFLNSEGPLLHTYGWFSLFLNSSIMAADDAETGDQHEALTPRGRSSVRPRYHTRSALRTSRTRHISGALHHRHSDSGRAQQHHLLYLPGLRIIIEWGSGR